MKITKALPMLLAGMTLALNGISSAAERGTPAEAKAMLQKAVEHYKAAGRAAALADFNAKKPPFGDRDLYVFCIGSGSTIVANGGFPAYVGASVDILRDVEGQPLGKKMWETAAAKGEGSIQYRLMNPVTHKTESKVSFFQKVGEDVCGVGAYQP